MNETKDRVYIGTILLEVNRWGSPKGPTYLVSEWLDRFQEAGFDGMELWEHHATLCPDEELEALTGATFPASVFNTYCGFDDAAEPARGVATQMVDRFSASGVKYNVGTEPELRDTFLRNLRLWSKSLPPDCRLLCECHGGTIVENPAEAARFFGELGDQRFQVIVNGFPIPPDELGEWSRHLGPRITHLHVAPSDDDGNMIRLDRCASRAKEAIHILREEGFQGSLTLEFTEGTRAPDENIEALWEAAVADLHFLRENL